MIYTVTFNPYLDRTIDIQELVYDDVNEIVDEKKRAGGKGIDVSRVIKELGGQSVALGFVGGYSGLELESRLIYEGIVCDFTRISGETRTNNTVYQRNKKIQTLLSTPDPEVSPLEIAAFHNKMKEIHKGSYVVISGNPPKPVDDDFYAQLVVTLRANGVKAILDTDGEALKKGTNAGPFLIKPNIHEFGRLVEKNVLSVEEVIEYSKDYRDTVEHIVVSMGAKGVIGISGNEVYYATPPKIRVGSSIGAGDSLVAGLTLALSRHHTMDEAIVLGVACGTASTLNPGFKLCKKEDVDIIKKDVIIKRI